MSNLVIIYMSMIGYFEFTKFGFTKFYRLLLDDVLMQIFQSDPS